MKLRFVFPLTSYINSVCLYALLLNLIPLLLEMLENEIQYNSFTFIKCFFYNNIKLSKPSKDTRELK